MKKLLLGLCCIAAISASAQTMDWYSLWGSSVPGSHIRAKHMVIDSQENTYVAASFSGNAVEIEGEKISSKQGGDLGDAVLVKMTADKTVEWTIPFAESKTVSITDLAIDKDDNIVVVGTFTGVLNPGGQQELPFDDGEIGDCMYNGFIARFSNDGKLLSQWGITAFELDGLRVSLDKEGNIYVGGTYGSYLKIGEENKGTFLVNNQLFIVKYNQSGEVLWNKVTESRDFSTTNVTLEVDENGEIYFASTFTGIMGFNGIEFVTGSGEYDMFFCKYDATGAEVWGKQLGGDANEAVVDIAISPLGDVALGGTYISTYMIISDVDSTFTYPYRGESTLSHLAVFTFTKDGDFRWQYWYGYSSTAEAVLQSLNCSDEGVYYLSAYASGRAADVSTGTVIAGVNSGMQLIDGQHISHNTNGGADAVYLVLSPEGDLCNYARPGGQQTEKLVDIALSPDKKSIYFLLDLCVRAAIADIPVDNLFVSFTDIENGTKRGDFTMITMPCPDAPVEGKYLATSEYVGSFFSTCVVRYNFPELNPNELPQYSQGTPYSQELSLVAAQGEALFIPLDLPETFSLENGILAGTPTGTNNYYVTIIASDKTPRYSYFTPYAEDNTWDETYGGETTRGNSLNIRNFLISSTEGGDRISDEKATDAGIVINTVAENVLNVTVKDDNFTLNLYNLFGALIKVADNQQTVDVSTLAKGIYIVEIITDTNQRVAQRIIVK